MCYNFDPDHFRRVIADCKLTVKVPSRSEMINAACEAFYNEFDYYPEIAAFAPGKFTIMGDYLDSMKSTLFQAATPMITVVVGKTLDVVKGKVVTTSNQITGIRKAIFPLRNLKRTDKTYPEWANFIKGVITVFPCKDLKGFDALIHSNVPIGQGFGSSAALQVSFFSFLEAVCGQKSCLNELIRAKLCRHAEILSQDSEFKEGTWDNYTSSLARGQSIVKIDCCNIKTENVDYRDINILFLLTYPNKDLGINDRKYAKQRFLELSVATKLMDLNNICDVTEEHLKVLSDMKDPKRDKITHIVRKLGVPENLVFDFVTELFRLPKEPILPSNEQSVVKDDFPFQKYQTDNVESDQVLEEIIEENENKGVSKSEILKQRSSRTESFKDGISKSEVFKERSSKSEVFKQRNSKSESFKERASKSEVFRKRTSRAESFKERSSRDETLEEEDNKAGTFIKEGSNEGIVREEVSRDIALKGKRSRNNQREELDVEIEGEHMLHANLSSKSRPSQLQEKTEEPCCDDKSKGLNRWLLFTPRPRPVSYIHERIKELCEDKIPYKSFPSRVCEPVSCFPRLDSLSIESIPKTVGGKLFRRVRHYITEKKRSEEISELLKSLDYEGFGHRLIHSHYSLKNDFEVSCSILDQLVTLAVESDGIYGSKMNSGGGTVTLLHRSAVEDYINKVVEHMGDNFKFYLVFPSPGSSIIPLGAKILPKSNLSQKYFNKTELLAAIVKTFIAIYNYAPTTGAYAPGVIHFIGDHPDFNSGFSLAMGTSMVTAVVGALNGTGKIRAATTDMGDEIQKVIFPIPMFGDEKNVKYKWCELIKGITALFPGSVQGFDCIIQSTVPISSGVSSKTALSIAFHTFLEKLFNTPVENIQNKAHTCMLAQRHYLNIETGTGDHLVSMKSKDGYAVLLDCRTSTTTLIPLQDVSVVFLLTYVKHGIRTNVGLLATRLAECISVARALGGRSLRCATLDQIDRLNISGHFRDSLLRARHVITENQRVLKAADALKNNDYELLGEIMVQSHISLRDNFAVTTPFLDSLVQTSMEVDGVLGSRMPSCGYENVMISLVKRWAIDDLIKHLKSCSKYELKFYVITPYDSCGELKVTDYLQTLPSPKYAFENIFPY